MSASDVQGSYRTRVCVAVMLSDGSELKFDILSKIRLRIWAKALNRITPLITCELLLN